MKNSVKIYGILVVSILGILMTYSITQMSKNTVVKKTNPALFQQLQAQHELVHQHALKTIKEEFTIPDEDWNTCMKTIENGIKADGLLSSNNESYQINVNDSEIIQTTKRILKEYGINPDKVQVNTVLKKGSKVDAMQDLDENNGIIHIIEINVEWCNQFSKAMQEAFVRHEIMHILQYDCFEAGHLLALLQTHGYEPQEYEKNKAIINYYHQRELRADSLGTCQYLETAQALCEHYKEYVAKYDQTNPNKWLTHPSHAVRADQLAQLINTINTSSIAVA